MIINSIDIQAGQTVQLRQGQELILNAGDPLSHMRRFALLGEVAVIDLDAKSSSVPRLAERCLPRYPETGRLSRWMLAMATC